MSNTQPLRWLQWARQLQAISQTGLTYSTNAYDIERFHQLAQIAADIVAVHTQVPAEDIRRYFLAYPLRGWLRAAGGCIVKRSEPAPQPAAPCRTLM